MMYENVEWPVSNYLLNLQVQVVMGGPTLAD